MKTFLIELSESKLDILVKISEKMGATIQSDEEAESLLETLIERYIDEFNMLNNAGELLAACTLALKGLTVNDAIKAGRKAVDLQFVIDSVKQAIAKANNQ